MRGGLAHSLVVGVFDRVFTTFECHGRNTCMYMYRHLTVSSCMCVYHEISKQNLMLVIVALW